MKQGSSNQGLPTGNPLAGVVAIIVGAFAVGVSLVLGFFAFVVLGGIILIMAAVIAIRLWWFNRQLAQTPAGYSEASGTKSPDGVIEGEFVIVEKDEKNS